MKNYLRKLRLFFAGQPDGYVLMRADGTRANVIRGDLIPMETLVIRHGGTSFIQTEEISDQLGAGRWLIYREGFSTFNYISA